MQVEKDGEIGQKPTSVEGVGSHGGQWMRCEGAYSVVSTHMNLTIDVDVVIQLI